MVRKEAFAEYMDVESVEDPGARDRYAERLDARKLALASDRNMIAAKTLAV